MGIQNYPATSIVIATLNNREGLGKVLRGMLELDYPNGYEVIVVDDGSTDGTKAVVESFNDSRISYEWAPNSGGPATPRNRGIDTARADWVCFLDADDLWSSEKLERVARFIEANPGADLICHDVTTSVETSGQKFISRCGPFERDLYRVMLTEGNQVITSATTVRREFRGCKTNFLRNGLSIKRIAKLKTLDEGSR